MFGVWALRIYVIVAGLATVAWAVIAGVKAPPVGAVMDGAVFIGVIAIVELLVEIRRGAR